MKHCRWFVSIGIIVLAGSLIFGFGCSDNDKPTSLAGIPPTNPYPANAAVDIPVISTLTWSFPDFDPNAVRFDVYFGTTNPPRIVAIGLADTTFNPGPLRTDVTYYWHIVSYPGGVPAASSPVWSFSTSPTFTYPIAIGNNWGYDRVFYSYNFDPDTLFFPLDTFIGHSHTVILREMTLFDTLDTYVFHTYWMENGGSAYFNRYLNNTSEGLYTYAYEPYSWVSPPKKVLSDKYSVEFKGMHFENVNELVASFYSMMEGPASKLADTIIVENPPVPDWAYPLEVGQRWAYRSVDLGAVWDMEKEVMGVETVNVPAGNFECFKIQWFWDIDDDGQWDTEIEGYDYVFGAGGVKRVFTFIGISLIDEGHQIIGTFDMDEVYELTDFELK